MQRKQNVAQAYFAARALWMPLVANIILVIVLFFTVGADAAWVMSIFGTLFALGVSWLLRPR